MTTPSPRLRARLDRRADRTPLAAPVDRCASGDIEIEGYLIAATAIVFDMELLTTNVRHFHMLPGLRAPY